MSRFSDSESRVARVLARNRGALVRGIAREVLGKAYLRPGFRQLLRPFMRPRTPDKWLFLVGCYNSGTTILRRLLDAHPQIAALPREGAKLTDAFPDLEAGGWQRMMYMNRDRWQLPEQGAAERAALAQRDWSIWFDRESTVFLEKSIDHTTRIEWLDRNFPNAHFVAITRNGYCVGEGIMRRARPAGAARKKVGDRYPAELVARQWIYFEETLERVQSNVRRFHRLRYEDLMKNPAEEVARIFIFLGLPPVSIEWNAPFLTINGQEHEVIDQNPHSLARLPSEDRHIMRPVMAESMNRHGYKLD